MEKGSSLICNSTVYISGSSLSSVSLEVLFGLPALSSYSKGVHMFLTVLFTLPTKMAHTITNITSLHHSYKNTIKLLDKCRFLSCANAMSITKEILGNI